MKQRNSEIAKKNRKFGGEKKMDNKNSKFELEFFKTLGDFYLFITIQQGRRFILA